MILKVIALGPGFRPPPDLAVDPELAVRIFAPFPSASPSLASSNGR
jgi:hypothetical protein